MSSGKDAHKTYVFRGRSFAETIQKVTEKLGRDAYIIEKREIKGTSGVLDGFLGGAQMVEILAAPSEPPKPEPATSGPSLLQKTYCRPVAQGEEEAPKAEAPSNRGERARAASAAANVSGSGLADRLEKIDQHLLQDANLLESLQQQMQGLFALQARGGLPAVSAGLLRAYQDLVENDVAADVARQLVERLQVEMPTAAADPAQVREALCQAIARLIETTGPVALRQGRPTVVALVGPTGVGKTTTVLKLAFEFAVKHGKRVGAISEDVRRAGAREQLRSLDQFLGLPVVCAETPERAREELQHMQDLDLILVDTAGRSPQNERLIADLTDYIQAIRPDETHLVVASGTAERTVLDTAARFRSLGFDRIVLSKLDEAGSYGLILNIAAKVAARVSYVTTGQEYMETVQPGDGEALARLVLGLEAVASSSNVAERRPQGVAEV